MKVLLIVQTLGIHIMDNQKWLTGNVLIKEMTMDHLANAIAWCWRQEQSFIENNLPLLKREGYTVSQWKLILKAEYNRRIQEQENIKQLELEAMREELEFKTKSVREIKADARKLLAKGDEKSLLQAKKMLEKITN